ncbi:siderophore-interacting protein [Cupriavidus sp. AU9028]|uniref:siderophore-interacting protein n=1 Tax=Cupriavidus sp. AU9028 TaxID=2871157 RepID=UPI001C940E76|nr:siderophore-interacting protein [Cupriavidus sp. AU9028]MBY4896027.1 siderophore-interacting protein [Cupriavidus sp. AU9028]
MTSEKDLGVQRVRHPLKIRPVQVLRVERRSPSLLCVTFTGDALDDFVSASFDDHVKVFLPAPGQSEPVLPTMGPDGLVFAEDAPRPAARDYTPRRHDAARRELDIEFVLHGDGPGATWAAQAQPGQRLGIGGPRGSFVIPEGFDWHLLAGDEAALPAISRRLEELPAQARVIALIEIEDDAHRIALGGPSLAAGNATVQWVRRGAGQTLVDAVRAVSLPDGEGFVWAGGEAAAMRAVRTCLAESKGVDKRRMRVSSYWKQGAVGVHETLDD